MAKRLTYHAAADRILAALKSDPDGQWNVRATLATPWAELPGIGRLWFKGQAIHRGAEGGKLGDARSTAWDHKEVVARAVVAADNTSTSVAQCIRAICTHLAGGAR